MPCHARPALGDWAIRAVHEQAEAPSPVAGNEAGPARRTLGSLSPGGLATLQHGLGNRGMAALIQRLVPSATTPDAGENTATAAEEQAEIVLTAHRRAEARRLLPAELAELSEMEWLAPPQGPGIVLGNGTRKLLDAVGRLGTRLAGPVASYKRDPATEGGPPSFVLGELEDPDGRITVTADGLLEVTKTKRVKQKGKKGQPAPPDKVTHDTALLDLQGTKIKLDPNKGPIGDSFLAEAMEAAEAEKEKQVLGELKASKTRLQSGDPDFEPMELGAFASEVTSGVYLQRAYVGKDKHPTELLKKVTAAFDELRAEFQEWSAPLTMFGFAQADRARWFAAKLQPSLFTAAAAVQSELDQSTAEQAAAQTDLDGAKAELAALKARKNVPKEERQAYKDSQAAAQAKSSQAATRLSAAKRAVSKQTAALAELVGQRERFVTTITWILDPSATTEERAAPTVGALCNVLSYFLYAKAIGLIAADTDFKDYYLSEVKEGHIRFYVSSKRPAGVYYGEGSLTWESQRNLVRLDDPNARDKTPSAPAIPAKPIGDPSRHDQLRTFLACDARAALTYQDFDNPTPTEGTHFIPIVRGDDGIWRNMDQTSSSFRRRGGITDWNRVYRIAVDKTQYEKARASAGP